jgi:hypothetical protein
MADFQKKTKTKYEMGLTKERRNQYGGLSKTKKPKI